MKHPPENRGQSDLSTRLSQKWCYSGLTGVVSGQRQDANGTNEHLDNLAGPKKGAASPQGWPALEGSRH